MFMPPKAATHCAICGPIGVEIRTMNVTQTSDGPLVQYLCPRCKSSVEASITETLADQLVVMGASLNMGEHPNCRSTSTLPPITEKEVDNAVVWLDELIEQLRA